MKSVLYYYNTVEGDEEIHEDEEVEKLVKGETIERNGEYWRIVDVVKPVAEVESDAATIDLDVIRVYLAGPQPWHQDDWVNMDQSRLEDKSGYPVAFFAFFLNFAHRFFAALAIAALPAADSVRLFTPTTSSSVECPKAFATPLSFVLYLA
jgi:hypothetical protein